MKCPGILPSTVGHVLREEQENTSYLDVVRLYEMAAVEGVLTFCNWHSASRDTDGVA